MGLVWGEGRGGEGGGVFCGCFVFGKSLSWGGGYRIVECFFVLGLVETGKGLEE